MTQPFTPTGNLAMLGLLAGVALGALAVAMVLPKKKMTLLEEFRALGTCAKTNAREMSKQMQDALAESRTRAGFARATLRGGMQEALTELRS